MRHAQPAKSLLLLHALQLSLPAVAYVTNALLTRACLYTRQVTDPCAHTHPDPEASLSLSLSLFYRLLTQETERGSTSGSLDSLPYGGQKKKQQRTARLCPSFLLSGPPGKLSLLSRCSLLPLQVYEEVLAQDTYGDTGRLNMVPAVVRVRLLRERWHARVFLLVLLLCNAPAGISVVGGTATLASEKSPSEEFAKMVGSKQARVCGGAEHQLLRSLAGTGEEVILTVPNEQLQHLAAFREEAELWVATNVVRFLPATRITHVLAGSDVLSSSGSSSSSSTSSPVDAYSLVAAMLNLHTALVAARLDDRVKVSTAVSLAPAAWSAVTGHLLRFLRDTGSPFFLKHSGPSDSIDARVHDVYGAMRALKYSGIPVIAAAAAGPEDLHGGSLVYHSYLYGRAGEVRRRSLAAGTFCVALQNADPAALQAGLNWACGQGGADCSPIQPGAACYSQNNLAALASYAYNDYYQKSASTGATCSFNGTATTTSDDPSSGSCVFAGSTTAGGSNDSSVPSASPPTTTLTPPSSTGLTPPSALTPPFGSSPPSDFGPPAAGTTSPPTGFGSPSGFDSPPSAFGPPGSATFGPSSTLNPYGAGCRHVASTTGLRVLSAIVVALLLASTDLM